MKQLLILLAIALVIGCSNTQSHNIKSFIPGVYVKEISQEFAKGMDTLVIESLDETTGSYTIVRRSGYQQTIDGRVLTPKTEMHKWTAVYNEQTKQLTEQNKGRVFTFSPNQNTLSMGSSEYRKIKNK